MKTAIKLFPALAVAALLSGCAGQVHTTLSPAYGVEQTGKMSAVKAECTAEAGEVMPKSLGFLETIPLTTYAAVFNSYAACTQKRGYDAQCSSVPWICGQRIVGGIH